MVPGMKTVTSFWFKKKKIFLKRVELGLGLSIWINAEEIQLFLNIQIFTKTCQLLFCILSERGEYSTRAKIPDFLCGHQSLDERINAGA